MNFAIRNEYFEPELLEPLFGAYFAHHARAWKRTAWLARRLGYGVRALAPPTVPPAPEPVRFLDRGADMFDVLVAAGVFPSKGQARKNWRLTGPEVPAGFNCWVVGKRRESLTVWNPLQK